MNLHLRHLRWRSDEDFQAWMSGPMQAAPKSA
ncbi:heme-degrading monooxygenase HmoA [Streptacidiphilus sp. BW17]